MPPPTIYSAGAFVNTMVKDGVRLNSHLVLVSDRDNTFAETETRHIKIEDMQKKAFFDVKAVVNKYDQYRRLLIVFVAKDTEFESKGQKDGEKRPKITPPETGQITVTITNPPAVVVVPVVYDDGPPTGP